MFLSMIIGFEFSISIFPRFSIHIIKNLKGFSSGVFSYVSIDDNRFRVFNFKIIAL